MTRLVGAACSDVGRVRAINQDSALAQYDLPVFAVADGMGGHRGGEVASALAIEELGTRLGDAARSGRVESVEVLVEAVLAANDRVFEHAVGDPELKGMGTTLVALALVEAGRGIAVGLANVGDSRVYRLADGVLEQLTEDHSLVQGLVRQGQITAAEAAVHPLRNVVTRVIGVEADVDVDWWERPAVPGERYLLCSDGLFNEVSDTRIAATLRLLADPFEAARALVVLANDGGGRDNITCVVVDVVAGEEIPALEPGPTAAVELAADLEPPEPPPLPRPRRFTGRVVAFLVLLVALGALTVVAVRTWAQNAYFVDLGASEHLVIYQGRPDGVLWFDPELVAVTDIEQRDLTPAQLGRLPHQSSSLEEARTWANKLASVPATTSTTVTSTTGAANATQPVPPSTTVAPAIAVAPVVAPAVPTQAANASAPTPGATPSSAPST